MNGCADVLVVGSGPSGVHAAQTLVEAGVAVTLLDVGRAADPERQLPQLPFEQLRQEDIAQARYFLGPDFSGIPRGRLGSAPQVTPPRSHVLQAAAETDVALSHGLTVLESHALGGLGQAWGAVSFPFTDRELLACGLPIGAMRESYERVARRIGIAGAEDELSEVRGPLAALMPPMMVDHNGAALLARHASVRAELLTRGVRVGRPLVAALSGDHLGRKRHGGDDLDFWSNPGDSVYRPEVTLRELLRSPSFNYAPGWRVLRFSETTDGVTVQAVPAGGIESREFRARHLIVAAGAMGTARIVLASLSQRGDRVPFVCNAHLYVPCLHWPMVGKPHAPRCHSLAQVSMIYAPADGGPLAQAQMYSYRSLLLFRLARELPLPMPEALRVARTLASSLVIWAVEHEDEPSADSFCRRVGERFEVHHLPRRLVEQRRRNDENAMMWAMRRLGAWPLRRVHSGAGSSLHYGGQLPITEREVPFGLTPEGRLWGTRSVSVADGAGLRVLPAKGPTFTLMANADRIARAVLRELRAAVA